MDSRDKTDNRQARIVMSFYAKDVEELFATLKGCAALIREEVPTAVVSDDYPDMHPAQEIPTSVSHGKTAPVTSIAVMPTAPQAPATPTATTAPQPPVAPQASAVPTAPPPAPAYTYEAVAKAGADLAASRPDLMPTLTALLQKFGVQAVTELKQEQLGPFAAELRQLGAKI